MLLTSGHVCLHLSDRLCKFAGLQLFTAFDKRDIDQRSDHKVEQLHQTACDGSGGFKSAEQNGNGPFHGLGHSGYQAETDGQCAGDCQDDRGDDKWSRHRQVKDDRETENGDFTDIKQYGGKRHMGDLPVMALLRGDAERKDEA